MEPTSYLLRLAVLAAALWTWTGLAQPAPEPEPPTIVHTDAEGRRTMLLDPRAYPLYNDLGISPEVQPSITINRAGPLGFDIVYRFHNTTATDATLGRLGVGIITLGNRLTWLHHARGFEFRTRVRRDFRTQTAMYPNQAYSPVAVLSNPDFAVGVSLLYDVLDDKHGTRIAVRAPNGRYAAGPGGAGYAVSFDLADKRPDGRNDIVNPATLAPGERRTYTVALRAAALPAPADASGTQHWLETLEPYREHFRSTYGPVAYERDGRPIRKHIVANVSAQRAENPAGFSGGDRGRPDLVGFGPTADRVLHETDGYAAAILWAPSGLNERNMHLNFPSRFTSRWLDDDDLMTALDPVRGLASIPARGGAFGLWWGRAAEVTPYWDAPNSEPFDPGRSDHLAFANRELDLAVRSGASRLGLDAFTHERTPVWKQHDWISSIRDRYPDLRVTIEPMPSDVMHTIAGGYLKAWQIVDGASPDRFYRVTRPHALADYLVPGHETWAYFRYGDIRDLPGGSESPERVQHDAAYFASMGYTPMLNTRVSLLVPQMAEAEASWAYTVPEHLKTADHLLGSGNEEHRDDETGQSDHGDAPPGGETNPGTSDGNRHGKAGERGGKNTRRGFTLPNGRIIWFDPDKD